jgi:type III pantothenate kinase
MNLILDIGNTRTKLFLFKDGEIQERKSWSDFSPDVLEEVSSQHPEIRNVILAATGAVSGDLRIILSRFPGHVLELGPETPLPITNRYRTKETLGYDRIAGIVEAHVRYPGSNVLVIDAGTALTYDLITREGIFPGGNISPGLQMRFHALADYTRKLPQVKAEGDLPLVGTTTTEAIRAGVVRGMAAEMDGMIENFREQWTPLQVLLTGGDAFFFDKKLKNSIFVLPDLTAYGLNRILEFNVQ